MYHLYRTDGKYPEATILLRQDNRMWEHMRGNVLFELNCSYLDDPCAISIIHTWPFELWEACDGETYFEMLRIRVLIEEFDRIREGIKEAGVARSWKHIADAMRARGREIRYISASVVSQKPSARDVASTRPFGASHDVELALENIDSLLENGIMPEVSAIDRLHTAVHGYMLNLCSMAGIAPEPGSNIGGLFSLLRGTCPERQRLDPIFRRLAKVLDALGSLRNKRSLAHPADDMLEAAEARLALNAGKTLLRYLDDRFA